MLDLRKQNQIPAIPIKKQKTELYSTKSKKTEWHHCYTGI